MGNLRTDSYRVFIAAHVFGMMRPTGIAISKSDHTVSRNGSNSLSVHLTDDIGAALDVAATSNQACGVLPSLSHIQKSLCPIQVHTCRVGWCTRLGASGDGIGAPKVMTDRTAR